MTRGPAAVASTAAVFLAAGAVGSAANTRVGLAMASGWVLLFGVYCVLNFWHCGETHCVVTGTGWTVLALLGLAAAALPSAGLSWARAEDMTAAFVVILAAGYALEWVVAARTGRRALRTGR
ncbi:hypothetical protein [Streptomyces sediminimaris]|uniref:hypothetical protein n=1 Tax=Streptomyces sediminimaris TaxID=3383721 RepID=UPI00399B421C